MSFYKTVQVGYIASLLFLLPNFLVAANKAEIESAAMLQKQIENFVRNKKIKDFMLPVTWISCDERLIAVKIDAKGFQCAFITTSGSYEYIPQGEYIDNWSQIFTVSGFTTKASVEEYLTPIKEGMINAGHATLLFSKTTDHDQYKKNEMAFVYKTNKRKEIVFMVTYSGHVGSGRVGIVNVQHATVLQECQNEKLILEKIRSFVNESAILIDSGTTNKKISDFSDGGAHPFR